MKLLLLILAILILLPNVMAESVSNSYGDPGDAYLEYSISGPDFSEDPGSPSRHIGTYTGEPIHLSGKMVVSRPEGLKSWVTMKASLAEESIQWPKEGEDSLVENKVVELPFEFTFIVPKDYTSDMVLGNARLEVCGGTCGVYNIDLRVSVPKEEVKPETTTNQVKPATQVAPETPVAPAAPIKNNNPVTENTVPVEGDVVGSLLRGKAFISRNKGSTWIEIEKGQKIKVLPQDMIRTESDTRLTFNYEDGSIFRVKSNTALTVLPDGIQLQVGDTWFNLQKQKDKFRVVTPLTVAGVLGTEFTVSHDDFKGISKIELLSGSVENEIISSGEKIILTPGQSIEVTEKESKTSTFDIDKKLKELKNDNEQSSALIWIVIILVLIALGYIYFKNKK